mmetsp:Transcript_25335/g.76298  ORF Transcript_25335/g.76298 Transcript_25335/m.76298 type:complete len:227 (+) Transcript_25335:284-964(+)
MRARCVSEGAATTTVKAQTAESPYWKSVGASMTTSGVPTKKCQPTALKSPQMMCGCISRLSRRRSAWSLKIKSPSAVRSRTPSLTTPGNARPISKTSGVPGACIARTTSSTSTTGTPRARSHAVTVDLPHAMPPVRPTRSVMTTARARRPRARRPLRATTAPLRRMRGPAFCSSRPLCSLYRPVERSAQLCAQAVDTPVRAARVRSDRGALGAPQKTQNTKALNTH